MEPDTQSIFVDHLIKIYSHEDYLLNDHKIINNKIDIPVLTEDEYQNIVKLTSIININDDIKLYFNNEKLYSFYIMQHIKKYNMLKKYEMDTNIIELKKIIEYGKEHFKNFICKMCVFNENSIKFHHSSYMTSKLINGIKSKTSLVYLLSYIPPIPLNDSNTLNFNVESPLTRRIFKR